MTEDDYWPALEYRICREFAGMAESKLRRLWCDGFIPHDYSVTGRRPRIIGRTWICTDSHQDEWEFTLRLPGRARSKNEIDWESLLPPENMTNWLSLDHQRRRITIEPAAAVPDLDEGECTPQ